MNHYRLTRRGKLVLVCTVLLIVSLSLTGIKQLMDNVIQSTEIARVKVEASTKLDITEVNDGAGGDSTTNTSQIPETTSISTSESSKIQAQSTVAQVSAQENTEQKNYSLMTSEDERNLLNASRLIYFEQDKADLSEAMKSSIREFYRTASAYLDYDITIRGVALQLIDESKSKQNAYARAQSVSNYLIALGVDRDQIKIETKIVNYHDFAEDELSKAISAELFFTGYQKEVK